MPKQKDTTQHLIRAQFVPGTMDKEKRSVDVTFATDTPVLRYSWRNDEYYNEVLDMNGAKLERAKNGLPVLDNHGRWGSVGDILGRAENVRIENGVGTATVRFSKRDNIQSIVDDVSDGIIRDISFGYSVTKLERQEKKEGKQYRDYIAREWEPNEISFVTIPADPKAGVRSDETAIEPEIIDLSSENQNRIMPEQNPTVPTAAEVAEKEAKVRKEAVEAERKRVADINDAVRKANLKPEFAEKLITDGKTIEEARALIIEEWAKEDPAKGTRGHNTIEVGTDREAKMRSEAIEAHLALRAEPTINKDNKLFSADVLREAGRFRGYTLLDLAKASLKRAGVDVEGMTPMEIAKRAITSSTSDFPVLLEGANRLVLLANYNAVADTWRRFCAVGSVNDFREHKRLRMGTFSDLDTVGENQEFKNKKITDADYEKVSVATKGNIINVSRQMIVNDDLAAFTRLAQMLGRAAARSIENDVYALFALNSGNGPTLVDGNPLFHSSHGNIAATAAVPTVTSVDAARQQMAQQKDKDANDYLDIRPSLALCPLSLGGTFKVLNSSTYDPDASNKLQRPNIVNGLFSDIIDTPRLSGTAWYVIANPSDEPVFEVNFLNGQQTPYMESEQGFDVDGLRWKIRHDYGVGAVGFRGIVKNAGTS